MMIVIESTTAERIPVRVETAADPTGNAVEFAVTAASAETQPSTWVAGSWDGSWSSTTGRADALSPVTGAGQALAVTPGDYVLWIRWSITGGETPVKPVGTLRVT